MVDCIVCHDTTRRYIKMDPGNPGNINSETLEFIAQNVGIPTPINCLTCHFADCGLPANQQSGTKGKNKTSSLPDIHMDSTAISFMCQDCHVKHSGHSFSRKMGKKNGSTSDQGCAHCHGSTPHVLDSLNQHVSSVACRTCHIPQYAQQNPQFFSWNWIMSGKANKIYTTSSNTRILAQDENGFSLATMLEPIYLWDDGGDNVYTRGQRVKPQELTYLQKPSEKSAKSKIAPFRVSYGTQMYDSKYRYLISPLLQPSGSSLFPGSDWSSIAKQGMEAIVLPFSGEYAFVPTVIYRRINHGVVSATESLGCTDCHGSSSRMPWEELGYEKDPWSNNTEINTSGKSQTSMTKSSAALNLQPAKDPIIPLFCRF